MSKICLIFLQYFNILKKQELLIIKGNKCKIYITDEVKDTDMSQYIKVGESGFKKALNNARKVLNNPVSQEEVDNALETLKESYGNLQLNKKEK